MILSHRLFSVCFLRRLLWITESRKYRNDYLKAQVWYNMKSLCAIFIIAVLLISLSGCYTQIGVKDDLENETGYSSSGQQENATYTDQGSYYGYEDYSLGCQDRIGFSYYYPPFFPSEAFSQTSVSMWSFDYQPGFSSWYGGNGYMSYGSSYYRSSYFHYPPAYARYVYMYGSTPQTNQTNQNNSNPTPVDGAQGSRDFGNTRFDVPTSGSVDLPRGAILQGSPRVVAPASTNQTSTDTASNVGNQRRSTSPKTGKRGNGSRGGNTRGNKSKTISLTPPNIKTPGQSTLPAPVNLPQNNTEVSTTPAQSQPAPAKTTTNSNDRKPGSSRGGPP
jgi:hypothetical protein